MIAGGCARDMGENVSPTHTHLPCGHDLEHSTKLELSWNTDRRQSFQAH